MYMLQYKHDFSETKILVLIINFSSFDKYFNKMKIYDFSSYKLLKVIFYEKWLDQLFIFSFFYFVYITNTSFCIILSTSQIRWIYPTWLLSQYKHLRKNKFSTLFKKIFREELDLLNNETEVEICKKKKKNRLLDAFFSTFYLYDIMKKTNQNKKFQILTLNFSIIQQINLIKWKKIVGLAKKLNINLDFYNVYKENNTFFHYGAYKTKGIYCKSKHKINELLIQKNFLNSFITLFFLPILNRQFLLLPLSTNSINKLYSNGSIKKTYYLCQRCFTALISFFPICFVCGNKMFKTT
nr:hypothetical protein CcurKRNrm1_p128 [Cryptomonas curvata]